MAVQVAARRGQVTLLNQRLDRAGLRGDLDLAASFEELAQTVADTLDAAAPRGPTNAFEQLRTSALPPAASARLIREIAAA